jgi:Enoyl-(Acyl carrier protein) reductase
LLRPDAVRRIDNGVLAFQADVAKLADLDKLYADVSHELGKIAVLFCERGHCKERAASRDVRERVRRAVRHQHQGSLRHQEALPLLNDGASIILNTSVVDNRGTPGTSAYMQPPRPHCGLLLERRRRTSWTGHTGQHGCSRANRYSDLGRDGAGKGNRQRVDEANRYRSTNEALRPA